MAKKIGKEKLFDDYFRTAAEVFEELESVFKVEGVCAQIFGTPSDSGCRFQDAEMEDNAKQQIRSSDAWQTLSWLYDYAVDGILPEHLQPEEVVIGGAEVLSYITTENRAPSDDWEHIVAQGDGRFALDSGAGLTLDKLSLLAAVDIRTVRNAISAGELTKISGSSFVDNQSARNWLQGRRSFKPTRILTESLAEISEISTPVEFGSFLSAQRERIGLNTGDDKLVIFHPLVDAKTIADIESGVFKLPLDTVFPLADFYRLDRKDFLGAVMRSFYNDQLSALRDALKAG